MRDSWIWNMFGSKKKYDNYYLRFKVAFANKDDWMSAFPKEMQDVAEKYYIPLMKRQGNWMLDGATKDECWGLLWDAIDRNANKYLKLQEENKLMFKDLFNNDKASTKNSTTTNESTSSANNKNYDANNEYIGDEDKPIDDTQWKTSKYMEDGSTADSTSTNKATNSEINTSSSVNYNAEQMEKYFTMSAQADNWLIHEVMKEIAAPVQIDSEILHDWRGDYK